MIKLIFAILIMTINGALVHGLENEIFTTDRNHFLIGKKDTPIKAELGFKHRLMEGQNLFMAYHHKTIWNVNQSSSPVVDSNYNPSVFYHLGEKWKWNFNLGILEHLSNGGTNNKSRGLNMSYLHFLRQFQLGSKARLDIGGKFYISYKIDNGSPDIVDYMGIWAGMIRLRDFIFPLDADHFFEFRLSPGGRWGTKFSNGNLEAGFHVRPFSKSKIFFFTQYFTGRNEYLLNYKTYTSSLRAGISLDL